MAIKAILINCSKFSIYCIYLAFVCLSHSLFLFSPWSSPKSPLIRLTVCVGLLPFNHLLRPPNHIHPYTHMYLDLYTQSPPTSPAHPPSTHHTHDTQKKHTQAHSMDWKYTPTDTQLPLFLIITVPTPPVYYHTARGSAAFSLASIQHFLSPLHSHLPFSSPLSITIITVITTTSKAPSKPSHQGELSHGIKILFWCFHVQTTANNKDNCFNFGINLSVICCLQHVTPGSCQEIMYSRGKIL